MDTPGFVLGMGFYLALLFLTCLALKRSFQSVNPFGMMVFTTAVLTIAGMIICGVVFYFDDSFLKGLD